MRSLILISKIAARLGCKQIVYGLLKSLPIFSPPAIIYAIVLKRQSVSANLYIKMMAVLA